MCTICEQLYNQLWNTWQIDDNSDEDIDNSQNDEK